jgi:hypothetical protein
VKRHLADLRLRWGLWIVRDATGNVIHRDAYYAHDARMIGVILIAEAATTPTPSS